MSPDKPFADQRQSDPQSWNIYAYVGNNPMKFIDTNGDWRTAIHIDIINGAFDKLTKPQREVMQGASERVDGPLGQLSENAYMHGMRGNFQTREKAKELAENFIAGHESNAQVLATLSSGVSKAALDEFGMALHTVTDRLSPAHAGEQLWTGVGEPGVLANAGGEPGLIVGAAIDVARAVAHDRKEKTLSTKQYTEAVNSAREEYLKTFGETAFEKATGCKKVSGCAIDYGNLRGENRTN
jgi:hypothetical protein